VHVNEPGRTAWEGYETATRAAAMGGVTTLVDMPLNSIPATTSVAALEEKRAVAAGRCAVDVGFWGGVVPGNADVLADLVDAGVLGFKCFLIDSGVPEFPPVGAADIARSLAILGEAGVPLLAHAELEEPIVRAAARLQGLDPRTYRFHLESRPKEAENAAVALLVDLLRGAPSRASGSSGKRSGGSGAHVHVVHHSSSEALATLAQARAEGLALTVETCPHYLTFCAEEIEDGATAFKCTPPIRERDNQEALWEALEGGLIDAVVSDHSPCTAGLKALDTGDFDKAWGGVASLQLTLAATWTGARARGRTLVELSRWMSEAPAKLAGLRQKGDIAVGKDADLVVLRPEAPFFVDAQALAHKNKVTPYDGRALVGVVEETWLRGRRIYARADGNTDETGAVIPAGGRLLRP
jgi:allantoinase